MDLIVYFLTCFHSGMNQRNYTVALCLVHKYFSCLLFIRLCTPMSCTICRWTFSCLELCIYYTFLFVSTTLSFYLCTVRLLFLFLIALHLQCVSITPHFRQQNQTFFLNLKFTLCHIFIKQLDFSESICCFVTEALILCICGLRVCIYSLG